MPSRMSAIGGKADIFNRNACFSLNANTSYTRPIISAFSERPLKIYLVFCTAGFQLEAFLQQLTEEYLTASKIDRLMS